MLLFYNLFCHTMINQQSIDARDFLSEKRNGMMVLRWIRNQEQREQLIEAFKKEISWEEYQQCLEIKMKDIEIIRQYGERKKWWKLTPSEFSKEKWKFYEDSPVKFYESLRKKPYLTQAEMERLIDHFKYSSRHVAVFYIKLGDFCLKWITDDQAKMLSESGATGIILNKRILTSKHKRILRWMLDT